MDDRRVNGDACLLESCVLQVRLDLSIEIDAPIMAPQQQTLLFGYTEWVARLREF